MSGLPVCGACASAIFGLVLISPAQAQDCDPSKFDIRDYERLDFSQSLQLAVVDILDSSNEEVRNSKFDFAAVIKGVPIKVGFDDAKRLSSYIQQSNSMNYSKNEKINHPELPISQP